MGNSEKQSAKLNFANWFSPKLTSGCIDIWIGKIQFTDKMFDCLSSVNTWWNSNWNLNDNERYFIWIVHQFRFLPAALIMPK